MGQLKRYSGYDWTKNEITEGWDTAKDIWAWARQHSWRTTLRAAARRKWWPWYAVIVFVAAASAVLSSKHEVIANAIHPYSEKIASSPWAWIVPIIALIIVSFPPLFGHEILLLVCGLVYGLFKGFLIACAGTFLGELATYVAFKYAFRTKAQQFEQKSIMYACVAKLMREGGLSMLIIVRFSAMPGHVVTAIQSCIGVGVWKYGIACFLTLPKQFSLVYIGKTFGNVALQTGPDAPFRTPEQQKAYDDNHAYQNKISLIVFFITALATFIAAWFIIVRARRIRPRVMAEMQARQLAEAGIPLDDPELGVVQSKDSAISLSHKYNQFDSSFRLNPETALRHSQLKRDTFYGGGLASPSLPDLPYSDQQDAAPVDVDEDKLDDYFASRAAEVGRRSTLPAKFVKPRTSDPLLPRESSSTLGSDA